MNKLTDPAQVLYSLKVELASFSFVQARLGEIEGGALNSFGRGYMSGLERAIAMLAGDEDETQTIWE